jgi:AcrR family transcriptional regulator
MAGVTQRSYHAPVSDSTSTRAAQKARTRARIRTAAHAMFAAAGFDAVTIADIAAAAGVSVQTVFNHFASKEELFFADRAEWVEGPARAVRTRRAGERPKDVLRQHLHGTVEGYMKAATTDPNHRRMIEVLVSTPALLAYERSLHEETVARLGAALAEAWGCQDENDTSACSTVLAEVTASVWMAAVRSIIVEMRSVPPTFGDETAVRSTVELTERVLADLSSGLNFAEVSAAGTLCQVA